MNELSNRETEAEEEAAGAEMAGKGNGATSKPLDHCFH